MLVHEAASFDDPDAVRWAANLEPLAEILTERFLDWLPKATYPERDGMHNNSAFGLSRALPFAQAAAAASRPALLDAIADAAERWFAADVDAPARWEPSGSDFLSPCLTEAELMASLLAPTTSPPGSTGSSSASSTTSPRRSSRPPSSPTQATA